MIIAIGGQKGGSGKSTTVANLAACFAMKGYSVSIYEADPHQGSIFDWGLYRREGNVKPEIPVHPGEELHINQIEMDPADVKIVDLQGADTQWNRAMIRVSDAWLIPFKPTQLDLNTTIVIRAMLSVLRQERPDILFHIFLNEAPTTNQREEREALELLRASGLQPLQTVIHRRTAYCSCMSLGKGVIEMEMRDTKSQQEFLALYTELESAYKNLLQPLKTFNNGSYQENNLHGT
jgi:chromosome partitioning protein